MEEENGGFGRCWGNVYIAVCGGRRGGFEAFAVLGERDMCHGAARRRMNLFKVKKETSVKASGYGTPLCVEYFSQAEVS
jgi:hypothetical protein